MWRFKLLLFACSSTIVEFRKLLPKMKASFWDRPFVIQDEMRFVHIPLFRPNKTYGNATK